MKRFGFWSKAGLFGLILLPAALAWGHAYVLEMDYAWMPGVIVILLCAFLGGLASAKLGWKIRIAALLIAGLHFVSGTIANLVLNYEVMDHDPALSLVVLVVLMLSFLIGIAASAGYRCSPNCPLQF